MFFHAKHETHDLLTLVSFYEFITFIKCTLVKPVFLHYNKITNKGVSFFAGRKGKKMDKKLHMILLLFCVGISLSACKTKQYELELLSAVSDTLDEETDEAISAFPIVVTEEPNRYYFVHICGAVVSPGVYEVASESRIFEVLHLAGGFTDDAAVDAVNLAMPVTDGSKIVIPTYEEIAALKVSDQQVSDWQASDWQVSDQPFSAWISSEAAGKANEDTASELTGLVNINTASLDSLMTLPGIGKSKAESIISYREEKGKFAVIEDIMKITGIKDAVFSKIKDRICV